MTVSALYLSGGGARAAYQVGILRAVNDVMQTQYCPFDLICGASAGAFNAAAVAMDADSMDLTIEHLDYVWGNFTPDQVIQTHLGQLIGTNLRFLGASLFGAKGAIAPKSLLNNRPLRRLMARHIDFNKITNNLSEGYLRAFSITATDYGTGRSTSFYQSGEPIETWERNKRIGVNETITLDHLMASSAIPFAFPAVSLNDTYYGDGAIREFTPLSTPIHLGADRIMTIGLNNAAATSKPLSEYPKPGALAEFLMDSVFMDTIDGDIERAQRINEMLKICSELPMRHIKTLCIRPQHDFAKIAQDYMTDLPISMRYLQYVTGGSKSSGLISYLLFHAPFTRRLMALGYEDGMNQAKDIEDFFRD
ncbi:patatin-like phospholipase family protein [Cardiobacteriaceae bacterium TAE3-ERU3]|nr:patatin-like phospholipase family protein [Cardiobacteriaceae bacterium TAE3-ERU3]